LPGLASRRPDHASADEENRHGDDHDFAEHTLARRNLIEEAGTLLATIPKLLDDESLRAVASAPGAAGVRVWEVTSG
jgi:hypothetical protein